MAAGGPDDSELVRRAQAGDGEAFRLLHEAHRDVAFRVAWRLLGNREDALDVVQDGFVRAFAALGSLGDGAGFRAWLLRIVSNRAIDWRRARRLRRMRPLHAADDDAPGIAEPAAVDPPDAEIQQRELAEAVQHALDRLPDDSRTVLAMYATGQMSYQQIAEALGIPIGTVMSRLYHARRRMRDLLADHLDPGTARRSEKTA